MVSILHPRTIRSDVQEQEKTDFLAEEGTNWPVLFSFFTRSAIECMISIPLVRVDIYLIY